MLQDVRLAFRSLRATPIVTAVAALSLALGIGANTAIFSLVNSLLLRSLPVASPDRLVAVSTGPSLSQQHYSFATFDQIRQHIPTFDGALAWAGPGRFTLSDQSNPQAVDGIFVSDDFFATLGVHMLLGRGFTPADDARGGGSAGPAVVISYGLWQQRYGGAASVIGTPVVVERAPATIVGVTPPAFFGIEVGRTFEIALPLHTQPLIRAGAANTDDSVGLQVMLRLKPSQPLDAATATLRAAQPMIRATSMPKGWAQAPEAYLADPFLLDRSGGGISPLRQRFARPLVTILVVVGLVLVIACANIANLLLARGAARRHELTVRLALGASRWRLARPMLVESLVLSVMGTAAGLLFAGWASRLLVAQLSTSVTHVMLDLSLDWRVLAFTATTMAATAIVFGVVPAIQATRVAPIDALKQHGLDAASDGRFTLSNMLVVSQVALSLILVVAAGLFVGTFERLAQSSLGFDHDRILVVGVNAARTAVAPADRWAFYQRLVNAASAVPGVAQAGGSMTTPISDADFRMFASVPGVERRANADQSARINFVTPGWLATYGTAVRAGRDVSDRDTNATPPIVLVNEAFVRRFLADKNPIGAAITVALGTGGEIPLGSRTVEGVVADAVYKSVREAAPPTMYFPAAQWSFPIPMVPTFFVGVRSAIASPELLIRSVASAMTGVNPDITLTFRTLSDQINASLIQERLVAMIAGFFGALALLLAGLGLYGVTSYAVSRRRTEIGIRMALGAAPGGVIRLVLSRVTMLVGIGVVVGTGISIWASTFVATLLYGLEPRDPITLIGAAIVLASVGAAAGWLPAYRASRIDPAEVLRDS